jgi:hypothetical protein
MDDFEAARKATQQHEDVLTVSRELADARNAVGRVDFGTAQSVIQADFDMSMAPYAAALALGKAMEPWTAAAAQSIAAAMEPLTRAAARSVAQALEPLATAAARSVAQALAPMSSVAAKSIAASLDPLMVGLAESISGMLDNSGFAAALAGIGSASSVRLATSILGSDELASAVASSNVRPTEFADSAVDDEPTAPELAESLRRADPLGLIFLRRKLTGEDIAFLGVVVSFVGSYALQYGAPEDAAAATLLAFILLRAILGNMGSIFPPQV